MAIINKKRQDIKWNGVSWERTFTETLAELVIVEIGAGDGGADLLLTDVLDDIATQIDDIKTDVTALETLTDGLDDHLSDTNVHTTSGDKSKLSKLAADADATYATKTELGTHVDNTTVHVSSGQADKLSKLAADPNATYATKEELANKTKEYMYATYAEMEADLVNFVKTDVGVKAILKDPTTDESLDLEDFEGLAYYMLQWDDGEDEPYWEYMYKVGGAVEITISWEDLEDGPASSAADIDAAVADAHKHGKTVSGSFVSNKAVLDDLTDGGADGLMYKGAQVGGVYNKTYLTDLEPTSPNIGDTWMPEIV